MRIKGGYYGLNKLIRAYKNGKVIWQALVKLDTHGEAEQYLFALASPTLFSRIATKGQHQGESYEDVLLHLFDMVGAVGEVVIPCYCLGKPVIFVLVNGTGDSQNVSYGNAFGRLFDIIKGSLEMKSITNAVSEGKLRWILPSSVRNVIRVYTPVKIRLFTLIPSVGEVDAQSFGEALATIWKIVSAYGLEEICTDAKSKITLYSLLSAASENISRFYFSAAASLRGFAISSGTTITKVFTKAASGVLKFFYFGGTNIVRIYNIARLHLFKIFNAAGSSASRILTSSSNSLLGLRKGNGKSSATMFSVVRCRLFVFLASEGISVAKNKIYTILRSIKIVAGRGSTYLQSLTTAKADRFKFSSLLGKLTTLLDAKGFGKALQTLRATAQQSSKVVGRAFGRLFIFFLLKGKSTVYEKGVGFPTECARVGSPGISKNELIDFVTMRLFARLDTDATSCAENNAVGDPVACGALISNGYVNVELYGKANYNHFTILSCSGVSINKTNNTANAVLWMKPIQQNNTLYIRSVYEATLEGDVLSLK